MSEPTTVNLALIVPNTGDLAGVWGADALNPDFNSIDGFLGGVQTISASNANIVLTAPSGSITPSGGPTQAQNCVLRFTGTLTGNVQVTLPLPGYMIIENLTTGNFVLSFAAASAGNVIATQQGSCRHIYNDGTNVKFVNLPDVGTYLDYAASTVPAWISACTVAPYLNCDGTTFSAATYPYLNSFLGGNTLPDLRGVARYNLNQGTSRITTAGSGLDGNTLFANKLTQTRTLLTANLPPYTPSGSVLVQAVTSVIFGSISVVNAGSTPNPGTVSTISPGTLGAAQIDSTGSLSGTAQGGTSTPFGLIGTGTVSGITLIRAA